MIDDTILGAYAPIAQRHNITADTVRFLGGAGDTHSGRDTSEPAAPSSSIAF